jgi:hypothetical protein
MMLAMVINDRERREELRMIIHPLSDDFIHGSPEALPIESYRMQPSAQDSAFSRSTNIQYQG